MRRRVLIAVVIGGISIFLLARNVEHLRRPAYETDITGDGGVAAARAMIEKGEYEKALAALEHSVNKPLLEVQMSEVYDAFAKCYDGLDAKGKGEPRKHEALAFAGLAHRLRGEYEQAEAAFRGALAIRPDYAMAHESLGALYLIQGRHAEAIPPLERAIDLDATKSVTRSNLAICYAATGRFEEAERQYREAERLGYTELDGLRKFLDRTRSERGGSG